MILPSTIRSGSRPYSSTAPPRRDAEAAHHLVDDEAARRRRGSRPLQAAPGSRAPAACTPMLPGTPSTIAQARPRAVGGERAAPARRGRCTARRRCPAATAAGTPGVDGMPSVAMPEPACGQQRVDVAVVAAGELQHAVAAGARAGQAEGAHRRLGAATRRSAAAPRSGYDALHARSRGRSRPAWARRTTCRAPHRLAHRRDDGRVRVAEDHRPPRADVVDVAVAVGVDDLGALGLDDEQRVLAPDRAHRPHRRVDPAGDVPHGLGVQARAIASSSRSSHSATSMAL